MHSCTIRHMSNLDKISNSLIFVNKKIRGVGNHSVTGVISDLKNVLSENGTMLFSTLIKNNRITDKYLDVMLKKRSGVAPKTFDQLQRYFAKLHITVDHEIKGNMAFSTHGFTLYWCKNTGKRAGELCGKALPANFSATCAGISVLPGISRKVSSSNIKVTMMRPLKIRILSK